MKVFNSVLSFGTTVHPQQKDGSDLTRKYVLECVTDRINDIFASREQTLALSLEDTYEEDLSPVMQVEWLVIWHPSVGEQDWFVLKTDKVYPSDAVVESANAYIQQEYGFGCPHSGETEYFIDAMFNLAELKKIDAIEVRV